MKAGKKIRQNEQWDYMGENIHGRLPNYPSHIELLVEGRVAYSELYEEIESTATTKNDDVNTVSRLRLRQVLSNNISRVYYSNFNIRVNDLEKKKKTGFILIRGRNILDLALKGSRGYKKALAFNMHKWNSNKMAPKESGDTIDDCIEYVRRKMYIEEKN